MPDIEIYNTVNGDKKFVNIRIPVDDVPTIAAAFNNRDIAGALLVVMDYTYNDRNKTINLEVE
jgi:hypothetical protein